MKTKSLVLMAVALGCGLVAMLGVKQHLSNKNAAPVETVDVLVASVDIGPNVWVDESNTEFKPYPVDALVEGAITERSMSDERPLKTSVFAGEFIIERKLGEKGTRGIACQIPAGMRVVSLKVDATTSHSGLLMAGNHVDVLCTFKKKTQNGTSVPQTETVLNFIEVFATDNVSKAKAREGGEILSKNISLLVNEEQSKMFLAAQQVGTVHLALRSGSDTADPQQQLGTWLPGYNEPDDEADNEEDIKVALLDELSNTNTPVVTAEEEEPAVEEEETEEFVVKKKAVPTWDIVIFEGDDKRVETVELPIEPDPTPAERLLNTIRENGAIPGLINSYF